MMLKDTNFLSSNKEGIVFLGPARPPQSLRRKALGLRQSGRYVS